MPFLLFIFFFIKLFIFSKLITAFCHLAYSRMSNLHALKHTAFNDHLLINVTFNHTQPHQPPIAAKKQQKKHCIFEQSS